MKVLVIDDDYWTRRITVEALVYAGHTAIEAGTGSEGLDLALREKPDCVLVDFLLPDCEGSVILEKLQFLESEPPQVIFITTLPDEDRRRKLIEHGAAAVFAKPIDLLEFPGTLKQIVGKD